MKGISTVRCALDKPFATLGSKDVKFIDYPGPDEVPPLLIAHGLFGSVRNWGAIAKHLSDKRRVIVVDHRNHGSSPWFESHSYHDLAQDQG